MCKNPQVSIAGAQLIHIPVCLQLLKGVAVVHRGANLVDVNALE